MFFRSTSLLAALALCAPTLAQGQGLDVVGGDVTFGGGGLHVTEDFDDRFFQFTSGNVYFENGIGLHGEASFEKREETGGFFIGGASFNTPRFQLKGLAGTSSNVQDIFPELYFRGEATVRSNPEIGVIATGGVTYRDFRNDASEYVFDASLTKYFALGGDNAIIAQVLGNYGISDPGDEDSISGGVALSYNSYRDYSIGVKVMGGQSSYDSVLGAGDVDNDFIIVQPNASVFLADNFEMFGRVEYGDTEAYDFYGGALGFKVLFNGETY